jgi:protocatechuate 3,4-dioxygenase beta subunit
LTDSPAPSAPKKGSLLLQSAVGVAILLFIASLLYLVVGPERGADEPIVADDGLAAALGSAANDPIAPVAITADIRGQVLRPNGEPASQCRVVLQAVGQSTQRETSTDAAGSFTFGDLGGGQYVIEASRDDYGPAMAVGVQPGGSPLRLVLQAGRELSGVVLFNNEPVPRATIHLGGVGVYPPRVVTSDATGQYRVPGVRPGTYRAIVASTGAGSGFEGPIVVPADASSEAIRYDFNLRPASTFTLSVVDRGNGAVVPGAQLTVADGPLHIVRLNIDAGDGAVAVDYLPNGYYFVIVNAPGYQPHTERLFVNGSDQRISLPDGTRLTGTVVNAAGTALQGVRVSAIVTGANGSRNTIGGADPGSGLRQVGPAGNVFWSEPDSYVTDANGRFSISGVPPSDVIIRATHPDFSATLSSTLTVTSGQDIDGIRIVLVQGRSIRGRIENIAGAAVSDAVITVRHPDVPNWVDAARVRTDSTGIFRFDRVGEIASVRVQHSDFEPMEFDVEIPEGGLDNVSIRLSRRQSESFSGRVFRPDGGAAVGATVWVMSDHNDVPLCRATVDEDAWFNALRCSARPERIIVINDGDAPLVADVGESRAPRDWTLPRGGEIDVVSQRAPVDVLVEPMFALPANLWTRPQFRTDRWTRTRLERLPPGQYTVRCTSDGATPGELQVEVREGGRVEAACPWMSPLTPLRIYVIDHMGAPVRGAVIFVDGVTPAIRTETNGEGFITVEAPPNTWLRAEAFHEGWGQGRNSIYVPYEVPTDAPRITLDSAIGGTDTDAFRDQLADWGINAVEDNRSIIIDTIERESPAGSLGIRRGDKVLWFRGISELRSSLGVRREGQLLTFDVIRHS